MTDTAAAVAALLAIAADSDHHRDLTPGLRPCIYGMGPFTVPAQERACRFVDGAKRRQHAKNAARLNARRGMMPGGAR